jgi:hypothetical protein
MNLRRFGTFGASRTCRDCSSVEGGSSERGRWHFLEGRKNGHLVSSYQISLLANA